MSEDAFKAARAAYYRQAEAWSRDAHGSLRRSRDTAWVVAATALLAAGLNGAALLALQPIHTLKPYLIALTQQRGGGTAVRALQPSRLQGDVAFTQAMLARYVEARESFDAPNVLRDYRLVQLLSDGPTRSVYAAAMGPTSGESPLVVYPRTARVVVSVQSVSLLDAAHAIVRFATTRADVQGSQPEVQKAQIAFAYSRAPMRELERFDNPLGFLVTAYAKAPI